MLKRILTLAVITTLLAGFYLFPAEANNEKLQRILQITGLPAERTDEIGGKFVTLKARLDRDMLVYGLPTDIPDNDWKTEADGVTTSWQEANDGIDLGHPGKQEPRYLGKTAEWNDLASDYFPDDAPNHVAPARRDMIFRPWTKGLSQGPSLNVSDYSWGLIVKALETYHERVGYPGPENGFANNPAFFGNFNKDTLKDYFLVMAEPQPGLAGAVRHWHYRHDLGGVWYDPIFVRWDILPNFIVESIDPGTQKAEAGKTYTGKVVLKAKPDASFTSDPVTGQLFEAMGLKTKLSQDYTIPFGVAVNGNLIPVKDFQPVEGLNNIFQYKVPSGTTEDRREFTFQWTAPASLNSGKITLAAGVNESIKVLPKDVWGYMDWSEITNVDNVKVVEVPTDAPNLVALRIDPGVSGEAEPGARYTATVDFQNQSDQALTDVPVGGFHREYRAVLKDAAGNPVEYVSFAPGEIKTFFFNWTAPEELSETILIAAIDADPVENKFAETNEDDNVVEVTVPVREAILDSGNGSLTFQAYSAPGEDVYGNWLDSTPREPGTARWCDNVVATLTVPTPKPPKGKLVSWSITSASLTYPKQNPEFMFGNPVEPLDGDTATIGMSAGGHTATAEFEEDWSMAGFNHDSEAPGVYNMMTGELLAAEPKYYPITADWTVKYVYEYQIPHRICSTKKRSDGSTYRSCRTWYETKRETGTASGTANGRLLVDGTGVVFRAN